jgi:hypothetical protein
MEAYGKSFGIFISMIETMVRNSKLSFKEGLVGFPELRIK